MRPYFEERNERIRKRYKVLFKAFKREGFKDSRNRAIEEIEVELEGELTWSTINDIISGSTYGQTIIKQPPRSIHAGKICSSSTWMASYQESLPNCNYHSNPCLTSIGGALS